MSASLLVALSGRSRIVELLLPLGAVTLGVFALVRAVRWLILPIDDAALERVFTSGVAAFLVAGLVGAVAAMRVHQLRTCPFAANLPGLDRRTLREYRVLGGALVGIAAIVGATVIATDNIVAGTASPLFLPMMAALGFGSGVVNNEPRVHGWRPWQVIPWLLILTPLIFAAELAQLTSRAAWAWLAIACGAMLLAIEATGTAETRRLRSATRPRSSIWTGDGWELVHGTQRESTTAERGRTSAVARTAAVAGTAGGRHIVRRTDWEWACALLHEIYGVQRGGWFRVTSNFTVVVLAMAAAMLVAHGVLSTKGSADGAELRSAVIGLEMLRRPLDLRQSILVTALMAWVVAIFLLGAPIRSSLSPLHPLSRARRARVVWLATQAQEWTFFAIAFGTLAVASIALGSLSDTPLLHLWRQGVPSVTAILIVMPIARWARLRTIDARGNRVIWTELGVAGQMIAAAAVMLPLVIGAVMLMLLWISARAWPAPIGAMVAVGSVAACFGVRWWWSECLRRHFAQCDL